MPAIPTKNRQEIHHSSKKSKWKQKQSLCESAKVCNITKVGFPNEKSKSFVYIRYFHIQQSIYKQIYQRAKSNSGGAKQSLEGQNCGEFHSRDALGNLHGAQNGHAT